jgi:hypothetical protein
MKNKVFWGLFVCIVTSLSFFNHSISQYGSNVFFTEPTQTPTTLLPTKQADDEPLILNAEHNITGLLTAEWTDLIPEDELFLLLNPPAYLNEIDDGSLEDSMSKNNERPTNFIDETVSDYEKALSSTNTIAMLDGVRIRIPGFIVPLEVDEQQRVTRFFVVPYFGACIHLPPPPPNQMIYVDVAKGVKLETISDPVWVSGELTTSIIENDMATAAYVMHIEAIASYEEVWDE